MGDADTASIQKLVKKVIELTRCTRSQAEVALYDFDNDLTAAVEHILDHGKEVESWTEQKTKNDKKRLVDEKNLVRGQSFRGRSSGGYSDRGGRAQNGFIPNSRGGPSKEFTAPRSRQDKGDSKRIVEPETKVESIENQKSIPSVVNSMSAPLSFAAVAAGKTVKPKEVEELRQIPVPEPSTISSSDERTVVEEVTCIPPSPPPSTPEPVLISADIEQVTKADESNELLQHPSALPTPESLPTFTDVTPINTPPSPKPALEFANDIAPITLPDFHFGYVDSKAAEHSEMGFVTTASVSFQNPVEKDDKGVSVSSPPQFKPTVLQVPQQQMQHPPPPPQQSQPQHQQPMFPSQMPYHNYNPYMMSNLYNPNPPTTGFRPDDFANLLQQYQLAPPSMDVPNLNQGMDNTLKQFSAPNVRDQSQSTGVQPPPGFGAFEMQAAGQMNMMQQHYSHQHAYPPYMMGNLAGQMYQEDERRNIGGPRPSTNQGSYHNSGHLTFPNKKYNWQP